MAEPAAEGKLRNNFGLNFAILFAAVIAFAARRPPFANEYIYLLRLAKTYRPDFLLNDLSFAIPGNEHWVFNHIFGLATFIVPIEFLAWGGRITCWAVLLYALIRLARQWEIPLWMVTASILLWLAKGQSVIGEEWMIATFEAKCIAYICLLFALDGFSRGRTAYPAMLLGATFSFHPAVGLWAILAAGLALLYTRREWRTLLITVGLTFLFALPGLIPLLGEGGISSSADDWKFIELVRFPHVFDPFSWSKGAICLVYLQLAFCVMVFRRTGGSSRRFLIGFLSALGLFFAVGIAMRGMGQYELLRMMPMRLFPVFVPLFFFLTLAEAYRKELLGPPANALLAVAVCSLLLWPSPIGTATDQLIQTYRSWAVEPDDTARAYVWLKENTPNGTIVIAPPWRQDLWYLSNRAQVASAGFPTYADLGEWRQRVALLSGESLENRNRVDIDRRPEFYNSLSVDSVREIAARSGASYLVTEGEYPFDVVYQSGKTRIYHLK